MVSQFAMDWGSLWPLLPSRRGAKQAGHCPGEQRRLSACCFVPRQVLGTGRGPGPGSGVSVSGSTARRGAVAGEEQQSSCSGWEWCISPRPHSSSTPLANAIRSQINYE